VQQFIFLHKAGQLTQPGITKSLHGDQFHGRHADNRLQGIKTQLPAPCLKIAAEIQMDYRAAQQFLIFLHYNGMFIYN
jgi:hypothetical protein